MHQKSLIQLFFILIFCYLQGITASKPKHEERLSRAILEFGDDSIQTALARGEYSLIYFYMDGCKYCGEFEQEFNFLSMLYNDKAIKSPKFQVLKTNGKKNPRLNQLFKIQMYPSLRLLNRETKEIIHYNKADRNIESLIEFINEEVEEVEPNFDNVETNVCYITSEDSLSTLIHTGKDTIIAFIADYFRDWSDHNYPSHFYQKLSLEEDYNLEFAIVDIEHPNVNSIIAKFRISNFPSIIYIDTEGRIRTLQTLSQNHLTNDRLEENQVINFINDKSSGEGYENLKDLQTTIDNQDFTYDGFKQQKMYGFNFGKHEALSENIDINNEYDELMNELNL